MIPADQIAQVVRLVRCSGSELPPAVASDGHGVCQRCEQPFRLTSGVGTFNVIPVHRIR